MNVNQGHRLESSAAVATGNRFMGFVSVALVCLLLLVGLSPISGAATTAGISGAVTDQTGAAVVGATVEAKAGSQASSLSGQMYWKRWVTVALRTPGEWPGGCSGLSGSFT